MKKQSNIEKCHLFNVGLAIKYGIEKAILLYNLDHWLEVNKANDRNIQEKEGKRYYWTYNSSVAFHKLFPYISERAIRRYLQELEQDGLLISGCFNKNNYDRTKWFTMPEYEVDADFGNSIGQNGQWNGTEGQPIPDINTDKITIAEETSADRENPEESPQYMVKTAKPLGGTSTGGKKLKKAPPRYSDDDLPEKDIDTRENIEPKAEVKIKDNVFKEQFKEIINGFKRINPRASSFAMRKQEVNSAKELLKTVPLKVVMEWINILPQTNEMEFMPKIYTIQNLLYKFESLKENYKKQNS